MYEISVWEIQPARKKFFVYAAKVECKSAVYYCEGSGASIDREIAKKRAIYESIERFCGSKIPRTLLKDTYVNLSNHAYNPNRLIPFLVNQYDNHGFPYKKYRDDLELEWVKGFLLNQKIEIFIPAFAVYLGYNFQVSTNEKFAPITSSGLGIQKTVDKAIFKGILELIERDAAMHSWLQKRAVGIDLSDVKSNKLKSLLKVIHVEGLKAKAFLSTHDIPIPSVIGIIFNSTPVVPYAAFGLSAEADIEGAILKALEEALMVRDTLEHLREKSNGDPYEKKPSQIKTFFDHAIYYSQPETKKHWSFLLEQPRVSTKAVRRKFESLGLGKYTLENLIKLLEKSGHKEIMLVNLTDDIAKAMRAHCVRVIIPSLRPMEMDHDIKFARYDKICPTERINKSPHPFT